MIINIREEDISPDARRLIEQFALYIARLESKIDSVNREVNYVEEKLEK